MTGIAGGLVAFLALGIAGVIGSGGGPIVLIFLQFAALLGAGYVAGRLAPAERVAHGSYAALVLFAVTVAITLATSNDRPGVPAIALLGFVAAVLGSAGGALAETQRRRPGDEA